MVLIIKLQQWTYKEQTDVIPIGLISPGTELFGFSMAMHFELVSAVKHFPSGSRAISSTRKEKKERKWFFPALCARPRRLFKCSKQTPEMSLLELFGQARRAVDIMLGSIKTPFFAWAPSSAMATHTSSGNSVASVGVFATILSSVSRSPGAVPSDVRIATAFERARTPRSTRFYGIPEHGRSRGKP